MKRRAILGLATLTGVVLVGCATATLQPAIALPLLHLSPSALGSARYALSQQLSVTRLDQPDAAPRQLEAQLQLDASGLLLAGFALGQRVLLMQWDGVQLQVQRHPYLPNEIDTDRVLRDICLVFWPADAVRAALPLGWSWVDTPGQQVLREGGVTRLAVQRIGDNVVEIINPTEGYRLRIESQPQEGA